jgi:hypothetical protein
MASGDGACAGEAQIENTSMLAVINRRLDMATSGGGFRDDTVPFATLHGSVYGALTGAENPGPFGDRQGDPMS